MASTLLQSYAQDLGIPVEHLNIAVGQFSAVLLGVIYRKCLPPSTSGPVVRHTTAALLGLLLGYFCFGNPMIHIFLHGAVTYLTLCIVPYSIVHVAVFIVAMTYLCTLHLYRALSLNDVYGIDGPVMMSTMKVTTIAFGLHDSFHRNNNALSEEEKRKSVSAKPTLLEYFSFILHFQSFIAGPPSFFNDYIEFIEGKNFASKAGNQYKGKEPSTVGPVVNKLLQAILWLILHLVGDAIHPVTASLDAEFNASHGVAYKTFYMTVSGWIIVCKYLLVWTLGDAACNASGFGFNGYDEKDHPKWDLLTAMKPWQLATATSFKVYMDAWNIPINRWLKYICYTRVKIMPVFCTFLLSGVWHGFYPGYIAAFVGGTLGILSGRKIRRYIRPWFLGNNQSKLVYDIVTWIGTQMVIGYFLLSFFYLHLDNLLTFYMSLYWWMHIALLTVLVIPFPKPSGFPAKFHGNQNGEIAVVPGVAPQSPSSTSSTLSSAS